MKIGLTRMLVLALVSSTVLSSCREVQPDQAQTNNSAAVAGDASSIDQNALTADPVTVVAKGLTIASKLKSIFGKSSDGDIKATLEEISAQNSQILANLGEIMSILNNLGATIRQNVRMETIFGLQSRLSGEAAQLYQTRLAALNDRRARPQAIERYRNDILPDVRDITSQLMDEGFGYSAYDTVGHGMLMEFWMSRTLNERASIRQTAAAGYAAYFDRAMNPKLDGTPGKLLADAEAQRERLKPVLDAADKRLGTVGWEAAERDYYDYAYGGGGTTVSTIRVFAKVTGNQVEGYSLVRREQTISSRFYPDCTIGTCLANLNVSRTPDPEPAANTPAAMANYWNAVRRTLAEAEKDVVIWTKVREAIQVYANEAKSVVRTG